MLLLIIGLVVLGIILSLVRGSIGIDPTIYKLIIVLIVLAVICLILNAFGLLSLPSAFRLGRH